MTQIILSTDIINCDLRERKAGFSVELITQSKNGLLRPAFQMKPESASNLAMVIAVENFERFNNIHDVIDALVDVFENGMKNAPSVDSLSDNIRDKDYLLANVLPSLLPGFRKKNLGEANVVKRDFMDMVVTYYVPVEGGTVKITTGIANGAGITEDELFEAAKANIEKIAVIRNLFGVIQDLGFDMGLDTEISEQGEPMFVSTNNSLFGAGCLISENIRKAFAKSASGDAYVLPSSIHECLAIPTSNGPVEPLQAMVKEVNATQVAPEEFLSDSVYLLNADGEISIAA